ncbi:MAG: SPFH domain-containing protein [Planctomycetes bacterium]|nr:SPFH domain-containing protein [Planctomycetota bacterium]
MLIAGYFKGQPTEFIVRYTSGRVRAEGPGLAFFYFKHNTQIVAVPTSSLDANFVFNEMTNNFQEVTIQGQLTYRIRDAKLAASLLNFTIDPARRAYLTHDPEKLAARITNVVRIETRGEIQKRSLEETLRDAQAIAAEVLRRLKGGADLPALGVELSSVYFLSTRPTPEVAKALEADYRETLLRKADEAVSARRGAAVDEERKIKEKQLKSDTALEDQRRTLILLQGENARQEAEARGRALELEAQYRARAAEAELNVFRTMQPRFLLAYALKELGQNAERLGNVTFTTDVLAGLLNENPKPPAAE